MSTKFASLRLFVAPMLLLWAIFFATPTAFGQSCGVLPDTLVTDVVDCQQPVAVCLPIGFSNIGNYTIRLDGALYGGSTAICGLDTAQLYFLGTVFNFGFGPYSVNWQFNSTTHTATVANFAALLTQFQTWDPAGGWLLNGFELEGGTNTSPASYGTLTLTHTPTGSISTVNPNDKIIFTGTQIVVAASVQQIVVTNAVANCADTALLLVQCLPENQPPIGVNDINTTLRGTAVGGNVLTNDYDTDSGVLLATLLGLPSNGSLTMNVNGSYTFTPSPNFTGAATATYQVCDNATPALCDTALLTIHVLGINVSLNHAPVANPDFFITLKNTAVSGSLANNDIDLDGDALQFTTSPVAPPQHGTATIAANGNVSYTPANNFVGQDVLSYRVCDVATPSRCDTATVTIVVWSDQLPDNDPPFAGDDAAATPMNAPVVGSVLTNDYDPNGNTISVQTALVSAPAHGTAALSPAGVFTYTPQNGYYGHDAFVYQICDNGSPSLCSEATVYLTVVPRAITQLDTIHVALPTAVTDTFCVNLSELVGNFTTLTDLHCDPTPNVGNVIATTGACMVYQAGTAGGATDTVCMVATDEFGNADTTVFVVVVIRPVTDTLRLSLSANSATVFCFDAAIDLMAAIASNTFIPCAPMDNGTSNGFSTAGCLHYAAGNVAGEDTVCVLTCDQLGVCDTTIILITVVPSPDTLYANVMQGSTVLVSLDTLQLPSPVATANGCSTPAIGNFTLPNLPNITVQYSADTAFLGNQTACVILCDQQGYCDTTYLVFTTTLNCNSFNPLPDAVTAPLADCQTTGIYCIPTLPVNLSAYQFAVDGTTLTGALTSCYNDTSLIYILNNIPYTGAGSYTFEWTIGTITYPPVAFATFADMVDSMNAIDPAGNWTLDVLQVRGGSMSATTYGNLKISNLIAGTSSQAGKLFSVTPIGTRVTLTAGQHAVVISDPISGCADTVAVTMDCSTTDTLHYTLYTHDSLLLCPAANQLVGSVATLSNACPTALTNGTGVVSSNCFAYTAGGVAGEATACLVVCDAFGNCDTTVYFLHIRPRPDTLYIALSHPTTDTLCLSHTELPGSLVSFTEADTLTLVVMDIFFPDTCIYLTTDQLGADVGSVVICDSNGYCDTTWLVVQITSPLPIPVALSDTVFYCETATLLPTLNDSIAGDIDTLYLLESPMEGTAVVTDSTILYTRVTDAPPAADRITYVVCNTAGCDTATVVVVLDCDTGIKIFTGFSPNGDGVNDTFVIEHIEQYPNNRLWVFNRWGNLIFRQTAYANTWMGTWGNQDLPDGTYFFVLDLGDPNTRKYSGYVQLHR